MRRILVILCVALLWGCGKTPTEFSESALFEPLINVDESSEAFYKVLEKHKGKKILINVWASWCKDCIVGLPDLKKLQEENPEVSYVFISLDKGVKSWKRGIDRFQIEGDHYYMPQGKKGTLGKFLGLWWIPRYVVVNESGEISLFKATKITDKKILEALKK